MRRITLFVSISIIVFFLVGFSGVKKAEAISYCGSYNLGDPACYTSSTSSYTVSESCNWHSTQWDQMYYIECCYPGGSCRNIYLDWGWKRGGNGHWCTNNNFGTGLDGYNPGGYANSYDVSTTSYTCHYISSVNSWSACVGGTQTATSVNWSEVGGASCTNVPLTQACVVPDPILNLSASPTWLSYTGGTSLISWSTANVSGCWAHDGWSGVRAISGSENQSIPANNTSNPVSKTFTMQCWNSAGVSVYRSVAVSTAALPAPTLNLSASPTLLPSAGGNSTLSWSTTNATACWASGDGWGNWWRIVNGSENAWLASTKTFSMECWNAAGVSTGKKSVLITVAAPPSISNVDAVCNPAGTQATISWSAQNANTYAIRYDKDSPSWNPQSCNQINPGDLCQNTNNKSVTVNTTPNNPNNFWVHPCTAIECNSNAGSKSFVCYPPAPTLTLTTSKKVLDVAGPVNVIWTPANATACTASNVSGWSGSREATDGTHSMSINITATSTFTMSCINSAGVSTGPIHATVCVRTGCAKNTCIGTDCADCDASGNPSVEKGTKDCRDQNWQEVSPE